MDAKKILQDVEHFYQHDQDITPEVKAQLKNYALGYRQLKSELRHLQTAKGETAQGFRTANANQQEALKQRMSVISQQVRDTEAKIRALLQQTVVLLTPVSTAESADLPLLFCPRIEQLKQPVTVRWMSADDTARYREFLQTTSDWVHACQLPEVADCLQECFGINTSILLAESQHEIVGALPVCATRSRLFGNTSTAIAHFNYGNPISRYQDVVHELFQHLAEICQFQQTDQVEIRTTLPEVNKDLYCSGKKVSMILPLPDCNRRLDRDLGSKVRAQINKADVHKPLFSLGSFSLLDDFYRVFSVNMRDLGTPVYSKKWFRSLLSKKALNARIVVCYVDRKPVSAAFLIAHQNLLEIPWASTLKSANSMNMNMWMYRKILAYAIDQRYSYFDFGRSSKDAGTYRFKKQWGAIDIPHYWYSLRADGGQPAATNPDNPRFKLLIRLWKIMPVWLTHWVGPHIIRQIP